MYGPSYMTNYNTPLPPPPLKPPSPYHLHPKKTSYLPIVIGVMVLLFIVGGGLIVSFVLSKKKKNIVRDGDFSETKGDGTNPNWAVTDHAWKLTNKGAVAFNTLLTTAYRGSFYQKLTGYGNKNIVVEFDISGYSGNGTVFLTTGSGLVGPDSADNVKGNGHKKLTIRLDSADPVLAFVSQTRFAGTINNISAYVE